ncbi:MAG: hypothetical protein AAF125_21830, partial [Chloroflexota bacterium]
GQATDSREDTWYQLDKDQAAPTTAAAEIWVAAANVDTAGDCENVADTLAPPIIPNVSVPAAPATTETNDTTASTESEPSGSNGATSDGFPAPQSGTYTLQYGLFSNVSCIFDGQNRQTQFPTAELGLQPEVVQISVSGGGASIRIDGTPATRDASGEYIFQEDFGDGLIGTVFLRAVSTTRLEGRVVGSLTIEGTPCSSTVPVAFQR